jgi:hypothetical protein
MKASSRSRNSCSGSWYVRDHRAQAEEYRMPCRFAALDGVEFGLIAASKAGAARATASPSSAKSSALRAKPVDGRHRLAQGGRQQDRGNGEVFVVIDGHGAGVYTGAFARSPVRFHGGRARRKEMVKAGKIRHPRRVGGSASVPRDMRPGGGIGRRTRFRFWRREAWGFESLPGHQRSGGRGSVIQPLVRFFNEFFNDGYRDDGHGNDGSCNRGEQPLERRIDMTVVLAEIEKDVEQRLKQMSRTVKMPGSAPARCR